ncbi:MAG: DNA polymerase, partial [Ignavibacteriales bacterium]|nr:DNA polymerase [Ignavibacteriales bacterium]
YAETDTILLRPDPITQYLMQSGLTLFKGMAFNDLHRLQLSVQTYSKSHKLSDARKTEDRIIAIALSDNKNWAQLLDGRRLSEVEMLKQLIALIKERDPDVIEGHNLYGHDIPYLLKRCELNTIDFEVGRDGSSLKASTARGGFADRDSDTIFYEVAGRYLVDTLTLAHSYGSYENYSLKFLGQTLGFEQKGRTYIARDKISLMWEKEPDRVLHFAGNEVQDIKNLSDHLSPSYFFLSQMCPLSYASVIRTGSSAKIESLLLREYIRQKHSIPHPESGYQTTGGYTDIFYVGLVENVIHADIESLYPSIMLSQEIKPHTDELNIFQMLLRDLTTKRLEAKHKMQQSKKQETRAKYQALQSSLKILINSFYGYLGYSKGLFNDYAKADEVTKSGQEFLKTIIKQVELYNGHLIEVDTDGLFFAPPDNVKGEEQEAIFIEKISSSLPQGINLALAGRYRKMLSYKMKNYALMDHENRLTIRGSALISRSLEKFARNFIQLCINCLLQEDIDKLHALYVSFAKDIADHHWEVADFARTETIHDSMERYDLDVNEGNRNPSAPYEVAKRAGMLVKPGDRVAYYVTGGTAGVKIVENSKLGLEWDPNFPDENTAYYLARLNESASKFDVFFTPQDFKKVFSLDDLFGFKSEGIRILSKKVGIQAEAEPPEESSSYGIWLDDSV